MVVLVLRPGCASDGRWGAVAGGGRVYAYHGDPSPDGAPDLILDSVSSSAGLMGNSVASIGDQDGDGFPDIAAGAPYSGRKQAGEIHIFWGGDIGVPCKWDLRKHEADLVIVGKGTQPNAELTRDTDIATDLGILVDDTMATSVPGVFAAGDVAQAAHCVTGRRVCYGTWTSACEQGRIAGLNMAGSHIHWTGGLNRNVTQCECRAESTDPRLLPLEKLLDRSPLRRRG